MRKQLIRTMAAIAVFALLGAAGALAKPHVIRAGNLFLRDNGSISPFQLPRHEQVPIAAHIDAKIGTFDGTHPPAVRTLDIDFDKSIEVHAKGLPVCDEEQLVARSSADARKACGDAIVGSGAGEVEVVFPEQKPLHATGPITLFNGGVHGAATLLMIHAYVSVPAPTAVIATVKITPIDRGHFGLHSVSRIPAIAGGAGAVTRFKLKIDRKFTYRGRRQSYLTASCPTGTYYTEGDILFADGTRLQGTHTLPCTPTD